MHAYTHTQPFAPLFQLSGKHTFFVHFPQTQGLSAPSLAQDHSFSLGWEGWQTLTLVEGV